MSEFEEDEDALLAQAIAASLAEGSAKKTQSKTPAKEPKKKPKPPPSDDDVDDDMDEDASIYSASQGDDDDFGDFSGGDDGMDEDPDFDADYVALDEEDKTIDRPYDCLDRSEIAARQTKVVKEVSEFLNVSFSIGRSLLQAFNWDTEKLYSSWAEDRDKVCKVHGVKLTDNNATATKGEGECSVCMDESDSIWTVSCGHAFCKTCWKQFLSIEIKEKKQRIKCPGRNCTRILDEFTIMQLAGDDSVVKRFNATLVDSYVHPRNLINWCPAPSCEYAIQLRSVTAEQNESVKCKSGHYFCFRCLEEGHAPAFCDMFADWRKKNSGGDDALNQKAIAALARPCPNCKNPIEKNGGCNHVTCAKCHFHFCWQCMGKFGSGQLGGSDGYSSHKCNNYFKEDNKVQEDKDDWERFRWFSERYNNHFRSRKIESGLRDSCVEVQHMMTETSALTFASTNFYKEALEQLCINRSVLMSSYIFGFYRPYRRPDINKSLFEHRQNELERHTEMLAHIFDQKLEPDDAARHFASSRVEMINLTKLIQASSRSVIDVAANALEPANTGLRVSRGVPKDQPAKVTGKRAKPAAKFTGGPTPTDQINADRPDDPVVQPTPAQQEAERQRARAQEQRELEEAIRLSQAHVQDDETTLLKRAMEESLKDKKAAPRKSQEEQDMEEAIRLSMLDSRPSPAKAKKGNFHV